MYNYIHYNTCVINGSSNIILLSTFSILNDNNIICLIYFILLLYNNLHFWTSIISITSITLLLLATTIGNL